MTTDTQTLRTSLAAISGQREAVIVEGPEALTFLQGQLSQDITALAPGEASFSLVLHPQGKISAWFRITRVTDERFVIDLDAGWADEVVTRLTRFKLRTKCDITKPDWVSLTIVGPGADDVVLDGDLEHDMLTSWAGVPVRDVFADALPTSAADLVELSFEAFTALRIEGGIPQMGAELDESTIPAAAGIVEQSVSFTKGCYTGQELVARIDSRGNNVPKRLVGLVVSGDSVPTAGAAVMQGDAAVGEVTSSSWSAALDSPVCLAYVSRKADDDAPVAVIVGGVPTAADVRTVPLVTA